MALTHEATVKPKGYQVGDTKLAHYSITYTAGAATLPANDPYFILLNGASLSTTTYAALFAIYGYTYGGSGANFTLPDLTEGRVPIGMGLTNFTSINSPGGAKDQSLSSSQMPAHSHTHNLVWTANAHTHPVTTPTLTATNSHNHTVANNEAGPDSRNFNLTAGDPTTAPGSQGTQQSANTSAGQAHSHTGTFNPAAGTSTMSALGGGVGNAGTVTSPTHNNMQPYVVIGGWLVKYQ